MNKRAFTLLELIVSISLLIIIVVGFTYLMKNGMASVKNAKKLAQAINLAQSKMELAKSLSFNELNRLNDPNILVAPFSSDLLIVKITVDKSELVTLRSRY